VRGFRSVPTYVCGSLQFFSLIPGTQQLSHRYTCQSDRLIYNPVRVYSRVSNLDPLLFSSRPIKYFPRYQIVAFQLSWHQCATALECATMNSVDDIDLYHFPFPPTVVGTTKACFSLTAQMSWPTPISESWPSSSKYQA
jgi:hypothetical protein